MLPRPSTFAEMTRGPLFGAGTTTTVGASTGRRNSDADGGHGDGSFSTRRVGREGSRLPKDFDFREAFVVHEDRELLACMPLREV